MTISRHETLALVWKQVCVLRTTAISLINTITVLHHIHWRFFLKYLWPGICVGLWDSSDGVDPSLETTHYTTHYTTHPPTKPVPPAATLPLGLVWATSFFLVRFSLNYSFKLFPPIRIPLTSQAIYSASVWSFDFVWSSQLLAPLAVLL